MRKILLLLCILSITISAKAQFGSLVTSMNSYNWAEGAYYDSTGSKHIGLINWEIPMSSIINNKITYIGFKPTKKADGVKIYATGLRSFVVGEDSIVVTGNELFKKSPFLKVLTNKDTTKLYEYLVAKRSGSATMGMGISAQFSYTTSTYYYGNNPDNLIKLDKKNFMEIMPRVMADKPEAVARIKNKKLRYGNMSDLLYFYKYDVMPPAPAPDPFSGLDH
jgi:nucleoside-specific outer membrane channel protein Tsx